MKRAHIVIIDDSPANIQILMQTLARTYKLTPFSVAYEGIQFLKKHPDIDLVLLDIDMPECNGYDTFKLIKLIPGLQSAPVIFVTARTDVESEISAFNLGIVDYIRKPIVPTIAQKRIDFQISSYQREKNILEESNFIKKLTEVTVKTVVALVDRFDEDSETHNERVVAYVALLTELLMERGIYTEEVNEDFILQLRLSMPFHDCGKAYISENILQKPDKLTPKEYAEMQKHVIFGGEVMAKARTMMGVPSFFDMAEEIVLCCHERWDGRGYPRRIAGDAIPLSARIAAIADVYDTLIRKRPYKQAYSHERAVHIIMSERGKSFDPSICDVFYDAKDSIRSIAHTFTQ